MFEPVRRRFGGSIGLAPVRSRPLRRAFALALTAALLAAPPAWGKFSVFPTTIETRAKPGTVASGTFNVRLEGEAGEAFALGVQDLVPRPDGSLSVARPSNSPFSASQWVSLSPSRFAGGPNRVQPVEYSVRVPGKAEPGDHLASLTITRLPRGGGSTTEPVQAISVRLLVRVAGRVERAARIASLEAPRIAAGNPLTVVAEVRNSGNVRLDFDRRESGSVAVFSGSEREAGMPLTGTLYPDQTRSFEFSWDQAPLFGNFRAEAAVEVGGRRIEDSASIFVVPWRQLGALILIALAAIVILVGRSRRRYG